jgi:hypothetical protein
MPLRKSWRSWARIGIAAFILNEVRGIITVALTAPVWWPLIIGVFHVAMGR